MIGRAERNWDILWDILLPYFFDLTRYYNDLGGGNYFLRFGKTINCHSVVWNWQILITRIEDDRSGRKKLGHFMRYIIALFLRSNALQAPFSFNISCLKETLIPKPTSVTNRLIFNIWLKNNYSALIRWLFNKSKPSSVNYERQNVSAPFFNMHNNIRSLLLTSSFR